jgi:hypothetical protein
VGKTRAGIIIVIAVVGAVTVPAHATTRRVVKRITYRCSASGHYDLAFGTDPGVESQIPTDGFFPIETSPAPSPAPASIPAPRPTTVATAPAPSPAPQKVTAPGWPSYVGGLTFAACPHGNKPLVATVIDAQGHTVTVTMCQNWDDDTVCGNDTAGAGAVEPKIIGCGNSFRFDGKGPHEVDITEKTFSGKYPTTVFIDAAGLSQDDFPPGCQGVGTSGTVRITYQDVTVTK